MSSQWGITWRRVWLAFYLLTGLAGLNRDWLAAESWHGGVYLNAAYTWLECKMIPSQNSPFSSVVDSLSLICFSYFKEAEQLQNVNIAGFRFEALYSLLTWKGHGTVSVMCFCDVIIPKSMHGSSIDPLHLVPQCISVILKEKHSNYAMGFLYAWRSPWGILMKRNQVRVCVTQGCIVQRENVLEHLQLIYSVPEITER